MSIRPQCTRIAMAYFKESPYGTAVVDGKITKLFDMNVPSLPDIVQTRIDDADIIKGHEFPVDVDFDIVTAQDLSIPFDFPLSCQLAGLLSTFALGSDNVGGETDPYTHVIKTQDLCTSDQLPSTTWYLVFKGDTASYYAAKGIVINELRMGFDSVGRGRISGTAMSDGTFTLNAAFSFPTQAVAVDILRGLQLDFLSGTFGASQTSKKTKVRGAEFSYTNNLDAAAGRGIITGSTKTLTSLRLGNRATSLMVRFEGHHGDEFQLAFVAETPLWVTLVATKSANRLVSIDIPKCRISSWRESFDGIRDVTEVTYKPFWIDANASPVIITVKSGDLSYVAEV